ncbi:hypothetical protein [Moorena sp. SIO3A5]|uniref:hypothetical protein n=1 Tax=Moorena sp. SIO3A5 TaxID=2607822 RepID=UPI00141C3C0D|nr:hypothetical protein [Moorena sp. SIO3A5]NEP68990.1 hypothetical protein [Moorena sp. SIO3A5]
MDRNSSRSKLINKSSIANFNQVLSRINQGVTGTKTAIIDRTINRIVNDTAETIVMAAPVGQRVGGRSKCWTPKDVKVSDGTIGHSGEFFAGWVEVKTGVTVTRISPPEKQIHQVALSYEGKNANQANWLQFLGPSVLAVTSQGYERLVGDLTFGKSTKRRITLRTTLSPGDTPYYLDSDTSPFANRPITTFCEKFASGQEKMTFFDRPIADVGDVIHFLDPFNKSFNSANGFFPESVILIADFYSYLVLDKTAVYLIRWQVEHEVMVNVGGVLLGSSNDYRQKILDAECGQVVGLPTNHYQILRRVFPGVHIR